MGSEMCIRDRDLPQEAAAALRALTPATYTGNAADMAAKLDDYPA